MGYFSNATEFECWWSENCKSCAHWQDGEWCPIEMAHTLYSYELCNKQDDPAKLILDMLIPPNRVGNGKCALHKPKDGVTEQHLRDWGKYKAIMREADELRSRSGAA